MKILFCGMALLLVFTAISCNKNAKNPDPEESASAYQCPMKCEGDKTYTEPGKCPVCGMNLKPVSGAAAATNYIMRLSPVSPEAGKPVKLAFKPVIEGNESAIVPLDEVHEQKLHLIIVSKDLAWYDHIHPVYQSDGTYTIEQTFPGGGEYILFADYQPTGGGNQVERLTINVSGAPVAPQSFTTERLTAQTDGYIVKLIPSAGKFLTHNMNHLGVEVTKDGTPMTNFENIMGAKGHLVIISGDGQEYLHVHPDEVDGKLDLHTQFEKPGIYLAYFQFQTEGKLHTSHFTIIVQEGQPGDIGEHGESTGHTH